MDSFSSYFEYLMSCVCGIPKITLEGSLDDWQRIRARIEVLETYGLEWWVARLRPILDEFVRTASGRPTREFWQAIYKPEAVYGSEAVTGWIADLFPYLGEAPKRKRNHVFEYERTDWGLPVAGGVPTKNGPRPMRSYGVTPSTFPSGLSSVPVRIKFQNRPDILDVDLVAGFLAVRQDALRGALSPVIGWSVTEVAPQTPVKIHKH
jgi:hypothetical protein